MSQHVLGNHVIVSPAGELEFNVDDPRADPDSDPYDFISINNTLPYPIAFKVKTTAPEKYRVRPSTGVIRAGDRGEICVYLRHGFKDTINKDKFLVMAVELQDESCDISKIWKTVPKETIMEYRLRCVLTVTPKARPPPSVSSSSTAGSLYTQQLERITQQMTALQGSSQQVNRRIRMLTCTHLMFALLIVMGVAFGLYVTAVGFDHVPTCARSTWLSCTPDLF